LEMAKHGSESWQEQRTVAEGRKRVQVDKKFLASDTDEDIEFEPDNGLKIRSQVRTPTKKQSSHIATQDTPLDHTPRRSARITASSSTGRVADADSEEDLKELGNVAEQQDIEEVIEDDPTDEESEEEAEQLGDLDKVMPEAPSQTRGRKQAAEEVADDAPAHGTRRRSNRINAISLSAVAASQVARVNPTDAEKREEEDDVQTDDPLETDKEAESAAGSNEVEIPPKSRSHKRKVPRETINIAETSGTPPKPQSHKRKVPRQTTENLSARGSRRRSTRLNATVSISPPVQAEQQDDKDVREEDVIVVVINALEEEDTIIEDGIVAEDQDPIEQVNQGPPKARSHKRKAAKPTTDDSDHTPPARDTRRRSGIVSAATNTAVAEQTGQYEDVEIEEEHAKPMSMEDIEDDAKREGLEGGKNRIPVIPPVTRSHNRTLATKIAKEEKEITPHMTAESSNRRRSGRINAFAM